MIQFTEVLPALSAGEKVQRSGWEASTVMFVDGDQFMVQRTLESEPYPYELAWYEIATAKWIVIKPVVA